MSEPRLVLDGLAMGESPRWHLGWLWFADWAAHEIVVMDTEGQRETNSKVDSLPFSIDWLPDARLLVIVGAEAKLKVQTDAGTLRTYTDLSRISTKPWNEIVVDGRANIYVNNIGFEFSGQQGTTGQGAGFIAQVTPDGSSARVVAEGLSFPNGMAVTPDNRTLIVGESYGECLTAFDINDDGTLSNRRIWAKTAGDHPDGICLDADGAVWYGDVGSKRCVRIREGGEVLAEVQLDRGCFACALGGLDRRTLYMVAADYSDPQALMGGQTRTGRILSIEAPAPGVGWP
jgi:sugar lactone lactonase YvrE